MVKTKRVRHYVNKQPEVGDKIIIVDANMWGNRTNGQEMTIVGVSTKYGNIVRAYSPRHGGVISVGDFEYRIYTDVIYEMVGVDKIEKKFLGITYRTEEIEKWRKRK